MDPPNLSNGYEPPLGRQDGGAILLSMLRQGHRTHHQQEPLDVHNQQKPGHAAAPLSNGFTLPGRQRDGTGAAPDAGLYAQPGSGQQQQSVLQPWQPWGTLDAAQQGSGGTSSLFSSITHPKPTPQGTQVDLQRLFSGGGFAALNRQPSAHQSTPPPAAGRNILTDGQSWQQHVEQQPLFSGVTDASPGLVGLQQSPQQQLARQYSQQQLGARSTSLPSPGLSPQPAGTAAGVPPRMGRGPPPGFGSAQATTVHPSAPQHLSQQSCLPAQSPHQLQRGAAAAMPREQQPITGQLFGAGAQQAPSWPQHDMQAFGLAAQHEGRQHQPQQALQQGPFDQGYRQPTHLQMLTQQRKQQQQQQQQQYMGSTPTGVDAQTGGNLAALMARLHLQHQQQQHQVTMHQQQQQQRLALHQQPDHQQQHQQQQLDLSQQQHLQMLLTKLHAGDSRAAAAHDRAASATTTAAVAAAALAASAATAAAAAGAGAGANGPPAAIAAQQQDSAHVGSATGHGIPQPNRMLSAGAGSAAAVVLSSSYSPAAAAGQQQLGGPASARSSIVGSPGGINMLDQLLSSSAPARQGFVRPGDQVLGLPFAAKPRATPHPPPAIRQDLRQLDKQLLALAEQLAPTAAQRQRQQQAWESVCALLQQLWPQGRVHLFGSAANGLDIGNNNDLDVCLELEGVEETREDRGDIISELGQQLEAAGMKDVFAIPRARMPVVKFEHPQTGFKVDVTVNNRLAVVNTKLLRDYASLDPRLRQLVLLVKHWAKRRRCNEAYVGSLSSYAYVLLCIAHLQARSPPVLPVLQELQPFTHQRTIGTWCCDYNDDIEALAGFGAANTESVAQLLTSFFYYWAHQHDYRRSVISVRMSMQLTKAMKGWTTRVGMERHLFCIEDPFELSHDLGRTVHADGCDKLRHEFRRAWDICHRSTSPQQLITELFDQAPAPPPHVVPVAPRTAAAAAEDATSMAIVVEAAAAELAAAADDSWLA